MPTYAPCPQCQNNQANPVTFTWWGGLLGPKMMTHVKCTSCGTAYNGKTGQSNTAKIAIYMGVAALLFFIVAFLFAFGRAFM